jgi:hypothetical protein
MIEAATGNPRKRLGASRPGALLLKERAMQNNQVI